ncbi:MAG TPA: hypothetical protein DCR95_00555, partial [Desulfobacter sp.]|nr:hypothetical protein [Desulfobacter sp.]
MKLRNFSILSILVVISFFILFHLLASEFIVKKGFQKLEDEHARFLVNAARGALGIKLVDLDKLLMDWANWDDSYDFVQTPTPEYVQSNLLIDTFLDQSLVCVVFQNKQGDLIYLQGVNHDGQFDKALADNIFRQISMKSPSLSESLDKQKGMLTLETGELVMIAKRPVLTSKVAGPAMGTIMFVRIVSQAMQNEISSLLGSDMTLVPLGEKKDIWVKAIQSQDKVFISHGDENSSEGFGV